MVWLLFWVVWDRPGIINELSFVFLKHGVNVRNIIGNSRALMVDVDGDLDSLIPRLGSVGGLEFLGVINGPIVPLTFSQRHFIAAVKNVLSQMGTQHVERVLYRLGYEYARVLVSEIPLGDPLTTVRTYLSTATAYNRLTFKKTGG
uniref:hypothetical protein n=1 Tax=Vulcanisaeta sp. JCM 16159 TaxID=1295371 RepID=UPI0006D1029E|nr:hypothetical protein [Vulcanisaeta sp. JCM 16159]